jgi:catechol 2,3-dioxygenase-like lactoylglutathione lyase family enzyme
LSEPIRIVGRLAHVALDVPDLDAAVTFYEQVLGLGVVAEGPGSAHLAGGRSNTYELLLRAGDAQLDHLAFAVVDQTALAEGRRRLELAGVAVVDAVSEPDLGVAAAVAATLPSGHVVELVLESAPIGYRPPSSTPARHHRGAGPVVLEHITLLCDDIRATAELVIDTLGLRISDSVQPGDGTWRNTHLRAGELHHDFALLPGSGEDRPELHHVCFAVSSVADLVRVADSLAARGMQLDASIGRHTAGNNVFLYFKDPFGHRLEVNFDMARVDPAAPPAIVEQPVPFDAWRPGRPPALSSATPARDGR